MSVDGQVHAILADRPLIRALAEQRTKIQAAWRTHLGQRQEAYDAHAPLQLQWQREKIAAIDAGKLPPPRPQPPEPIENLDGDFQRRLQAVDDQERTAILADWRDLEAEARTHEQAQIAEALQLPPVEWGPILADLSLLCSTVRRIRHTVAIAHAVREDHIDIGRTPGGAYRVTRDTVDEADLMAAWKDGASLLDPMIEEEPLSIAQVRGDGRVQVDRAASDGQVRRLVVTAEPNRIRREITGG